MGGRGKDAVLAVLWIFFLISGKFIMFKMSVFTLHFVGLLNLNLEINVEWPPKRLDILIL